MGVPKEQAYGRGPPAAWVSMKEKRGELPLPCVGTLRTTLESFHTLHSSHTGETFIIQSQSGTLEFAIISSINTMKKPVQFRKDYPRVAESQSYPPTG